MSAQLGPELSEISTQEVGFLSIAGDTKLKILPTPWPSDSLPPPTCSLLAVASSKGMLAAAGPQGIVIAGTDSVREAYYSESSGPENTKTLKAELEIAFPGQISHLTFNSSEDALVVAAQEGGLAVYDVAKLGQGNTQPSITLPLNGQSLRSLVPNPESPELFAAVTSNGELLMANLKTGQLVQGPTGPVMRNNVSCVVWSNKGKQLVAGLVDGTAFQLTPKGEEKAAIPRPPDLEGNQHISSAVWLENDLFYLVYTPTVASEDDRPSSSYYIVTRQQPGNFVFNKLPEVCSPFGLERYPPYQFTARLRNFEPDLKDALVVASTASTDIGLFTKSSKHLGTPAEGQTADVFTATTLDDSRRAVLPMTEDFADTTPIGLALDLSSKKPVPTPIPGGDIDDSGHPLPEILLLNNEGILSSWWFVYSDSIKQGKPYNGLGGAKPSSQPALQQQTSSLMAPPETPKPTFGQPAFGKPSLPQPAFSKPAFGTPSTLGANRPQPTFGTPSTLGSSQQASTTPAGPTFGTPSILGQRGPAFGQATPLGGGRPAFGQTSALGGFGSPSSTSGASPSAGGGFSSFASGGGFAAFANKSASGTSAFAQPSSATSPFANAGQAFGSTTAAPAQKETGTTGNFGLGSGGFVLGSTFKPDTTAPKDERPAEPSGGLSLGSAFSNLLNDTDEMATDKKETSPPVPEPAPAPMFGKPSAPFGLPTPQEQAKPAEIVNPFGPKPTGTTPTSSFAQPSPFAALKQPSTPSTPPSLISQPSLSDSTVKVEAPSATGSTPAPEPPLPPEPMSKTAYAPGDTSASSTNSVEEAPLPPDFVKPNARPAAEEAANSLKEKSKPEEASLPPLPKWGQKAEEAPLPPDFLKEKPKVEEAPLPPDFLKEKPRPVPEEAPLPPDFLGKEKTKGAAETAVPVPEESEGEAEFEDSGEEISNDRHVESFKSFTSPESSFGGPGDHSPTPNIFSRLSSDREKKTDHAKQLFGEIPQFPPPKGPDDARQRLTPRSPSPVRAQRANNVSRLEGMRSISAPSVPGQALSQRKATLEKSRLANQVYQQEDESADEEFVESKKEVEEPLELVEDEDEQLRKDLQRPLSPAPTLDPFLPHQDYTGEAFKPGVPGQIERIYRDINAMIDTLGINSRSLSSFLLYQESNKDADHKRWLGTLESNKAGDLLDENVLLAEVNKLPQGVAALEAALQKGQVHGIQDKVNRCQQLLTRDVATLRGQCASMRRTLDAHVDEIAIASAPLSLEQMSLQQELRQNFIQMQDKLAELESEITHLRASLADASQHTTANGSRTARPTVEAVTSTINTMTNMAERKSGDIDALEAQIRKLGIDVSASVMSPSPARADTGSPFHTPQRRTARLPLTPGSRDTDGFPRTAYHTPESAGRLRSSLLGRSPMNGTPSRAVVASPDNAARFKAKVQRRKELTDHVKKALENRQVKVRGLDE